MTHLPAARPHQLALLARADASALAADRAVRRAWARVRAVIEAGGPWVVVYTRAREALRGVELAAAEILDDVRAAGASARTLARRRVKRAAARGLLEDESGATAADPLVPDDLLPAVEDDLIDRIVYGAGWPERIAALTRLAAPDALAARIATGLQAGRTPRQVAADILPVVRGVKASAVRTARTAALHVAHEAELATYEGMGPDFVVGYVVRAVLDAATRPEHRKRDGWEFYRTPKKGQRGFDQMPRPPRESPRDGNRWAFCCRCRLEPIISEA